MRKFTGLRVFPAYRICITQVISVLPLLTGSAQVNFTNNDRSTSILIFSYVDLALHGNTPGRPTLSVQATFAGATNSPLIVINTLPKSGYQANLGNHTPLLRLLKHY